MTGGKVVEIEYLDTKYSEVGADTHVGNDTNGYHLERERERERERRREREEGGGREKRKEEKRVCMNREMKCHLYFKKLHYYALII